MHKNMVSFQFLNSGKSINNKGNWQKVDLHQLVDLTFNTFYPEKQIFVAMGELLFIKVNVDFFFLKSTRK